MRLTPETRLSARSWYQASDPLAPNAQASSQLLQGNLRVDVCVIGGGLAGVSAALELARAGRRVAVLEANSIGWGASGRNGGQALIDIASGVDLVKDQMGISAARQVWDSTVEAVQLIRSRCAEFQIDAQWQSGYLALAQTAKKASKYKAVVEGYARDYGHQQRWIEAQELLTWIDSPRYHSGAYDELSGHLHPLKYVRGLARAAQQTGALIFENTEVFKVCNVGQTGFDPSRIGPLDIHTAQGVVTAEQVVLAGNVYGPELFPQLAARIMPVGTYIVTTEALDPKVCEQLIPSRACVCDTNFVLDYFRTTPDSRVLFGGRVSYSTQTPLGLDASMMQRLLRVFPQLQGTRLDYSWGGFVDITMNRAPDFGRIGNQLYYLQGFSGHGLALTGLAGSLVAKAIVGDSERFDLFARIKHRPFPGGDLLRMPSLVLGMAWYRLRDALG